MNETGPIRPCTGQVAAPEVLDLLVEPHRANGQVELLPGADELQFLVGCSWSICSKCHQV